MTDFTEWLQDPDEYSQELADIILAQLEVNKELEEENESI
jgi:hypothetical protein